MLLLLLWELLAPGQCQIAGNFLVPAEWITSKRSGRVGLLWGLILGMGWITQAPFRIFHSTVIFAATASVPWWASVSLLAMFGGSRVLFGVQPKARAWILRREECGRGWQMAATLSLIGTGLIAILMVAGLLWQ